MVGVRRRGAGLVASASAFLAFGMGPLAGAPHADADILDVVVDPVLQPLQQALTGVTDVVSAFDPSTGMDALAGLDLSAVLARFGPGWRGGLKRSAATWLRIESDRQSGSAGGARLSRWPRCRRVGSVCGGVVGAWGVV